MELLGFARQRLGQTGCTCVLWDGEQLLTSQDRGVKPLMLWLNQGLDGRRYVAADKVIGKGTAFLYWKLGVPAVYAPVVSRSAAKVLEQAGIAYRCDEMVDGILNRKKTGLCPMESAVSAIDTLPEALEAIFRQYNLLNPQEAMIWKS